MIVTVLGGSGHSTPALADALARSVSQPLTLRLAGRDIDALGAVARACTMLCAGTPVALQAYAMEEWDHAIAGSDVIVIQIRVGGYAGRGFDERFPLDFGVPGDEGLGPGGLSAAYRAWPTVSRWLRRIERLAPHARVVLLTSPGSLLVRLAARAAPALTVAHVCELPATTLDRLCETAGVRASDVTFDYAGVNHLGWLFNVRGPDGDDLLPTHADPADGFPPAELVADLEAYPLKYLRLHYETARVLHAQRRRRVSRADELSEVATRSQAAFGAGDAHAVRDALTRRPAPWYPRAVVPLLRAWMGDAVDVPLFLTVADRAPHVEERRYRAEAGDVVEVPPSAPIPPAIRCVLDRFMEYEALAADAVLDGSDDALATALAAHPWVAGEASARRMATTMGAHAREHGYR